MKSFRNVAVTLLALLMAVSVAACASTNTATVAATVDGVEVMEADVTARIEVYRIDQSTGEPMSDVAWAKLLAGAGFTPESLREYVIKQQFAMPLRVLQEAKAAGILPDTESINDQIATQKAGLGDDAEAWNNYLKQMGFASEDTYRQYLEAQNVTTPLLDAKVTSGEPIQQEIEDYVVSNSVMYTGKRTSAIFFAIDDTHTAEDSLARAEAAQARLESGEDFGALAAELSDDLISKEKGGDMGWSVFLSVSQQYLEAMNEMAVGETSGLVETDSGIYILKVTDEFALAEDGTVAFDSVPADIVTMLTESLAGNGLATKQQAYFEGLLDSDKVIINPMPSGLPYAVDMALANTPDETATDPSTEGNETPQPTGELVISDTQVGTGAEAKAGDTVSMNYTGYLDDGTVFDSNVDPSFGHVEPFQFTIGAGGVIQGWDQGIPGMLVGGKRTLIIPPDLAYGASGQGSIPPNATLTFEVELISIDTAAQ